MQDGWNWPDKAEEMERSHEIQASKALLDTPGMSPQPLTWVWPLLPNHRHAEIWGTLLSGVKALWATHHINNVVIFPFYTEKKWKSWAVILWLDLFIQSYLMNIQFLWFTSNPRKPSQWSWGNLDSTEQTPLSNISITNSWSNASGFVLQYPLKSFRVPTLPAVPSPDPLDASAFSHLESSPCGNQAALEP